MRIWAINTVVRFDPIINVETAELTDLEVQQVQAEQEVQMMYAAQKDLRQFSLIYDRYFPRIYTYCLRRVNSAQEAEDLTSQVFTRAMIHIDQYRGGFVAAWLFRIAHNVLYTRRTLQNREISFEELPSELGVETINPTAQIEQDEEFQLLQHLVSRLPTDQQRLLELRMIEGLTSETIASRLGKTAGAVRISLHRIFRHLYRDYTRSQRGSRYG